MIITLTSKNNEKVFNGKEIINIGSNAGCDFVLDIGSDFMLTLQCDEQNKKCVLVNNFNTQKVLFKGQPLSQKIEIDKVCKLMSADNDEFLSIKISEAPVVEQAYEQSAIEQKKAELEKQRVSVIKQTGFVVNDLKSKIALNFKASLFLHIALFVSSLVTAFGVSNYLTGLQIEETKNFINLPTNIKILVAFTVIIYGICLILKQGVYLYLQNKEKSNDVSVIAQNFMLWSSGIFMTAVYFINLIYYININVIFAVLVSIFFVGLTVVLASACGYFKSTGHNMTYVLDKNEYREDFESVMNEYRHWIEKYINGLSNTKITNIKDKLFGLQLKSAGELFLGFLTAPFLAYGVSNTLAMCFPEAAGWIRISGLRLSPVFLVLATFLIVFAFFAFVNAFFVTRKIQGSNVIKQDGFSNYITHGTDIFGVQGIRKLDSEKVRSLVIGCSIILIEFTMNTSYFFTEIGGDLQGMFLSVVAALVPTALLIAETYMLSQTKFDIYACEELIAKLDRD
ncbi:MAG: hypothetical protein NC200_02535 [Candidatus Gastranaerophilales bacterium]|nr:hypothetical protein [Candidatus Gastranaerophilales bacterium]